MASSSQPYKIFSTVSLETIKGWASKNPNSSVTLKRAPPILLGSQSTGKEDYITSTYKLIPSSSGKWSNELLEPAGIISYILWRRDPLYRVSTGLLRKQLYNEEQFELQKEMESGISGTKFARRRRKLLEVFNGSTTADMEDILKFQELWADILRVQFVKISTRTEAGHKVSFCPPDVSTWTASKPIVFVDERFESVFVPPEEGYERKTLAKFISAVDDAGWKIEWPLVDGTKDELDAAVIPIINFVTVPEKAKKAELAVILGKYNAIQNINKLSSTETTSGFLTEDE